MTKQKDTEEAAMEFGIKVQGKLWGTMWQCQRELADQIEDVHSGENDSGPAWDLS